MEVMDDCFTTSLCFPPNTGSVCFFVQVLLIDFMVANCLIWI